MESDILKALRERAACGDHLAQQAADEIERLRLARSAAESSLSSALAKINKVARILAPPSYDAHGRLIYHIEA